MVRAEVGHAVRRALDLICEHPAVRAVGAAELDEASGIVTVEATFAADLPSEWRGRGESPSGVRLREEVYFGFPGGFPLDPPELSLRGDFSRNLPHVQSWLVDGRPAPCIYDGELAELLHSEGMAGILNQTAVWLERAALGILIDPDQGWEPVRRDSFHHVVVADADFLRGLVDRRGGHRFLEMQYLRWSGIDGSPVVHGQIGSTRPPVSRRSVGGLFGEGGAGGEPPLWRGRSLALVVWPGKHPSGAPIVNDTYLPETMTERRGSHPHCCARSPCSYRSFSWSPRSGPSGVPLAGSFSTAAERSSSRRSVAIGERSRSRPSTRPGAGSRPESLTIWGNIRIQALLKRHESGLRARSASSRSSGHCTRCSHTPNARRCARRWSASDVDLPHVFIDGHTHRRVHGVAYPSPSRCRANEGMGME